MVLHPKHQIPLSLLQEKGDEIFQSFQIWFEKYQQKIISDSELVAIYMILFLQKWKESLWTSGKISLLKINQNSSIKLIDFCDLEITKEKIHQLSLNEFLQNYQLRAVSMRAQRALLAWMNQHYPIILSFEIPSAFDLLKIQSEGKRILTLPIKQENFKNYLLGKDPFTFVVHDLKHADEFFFDQSLFTDQVNFYKNILTRLEKGEFDVYLKEDKIFEQEFHYVISDMNSHPAHLQMTLEAILSFSQKRLAS